MVDQLTSGLIALKAELSRLDDGVRRELACSGDLQRRITAVVAGQARLRKETCKVQAGSVELDEQRADMDALLTCCKGELHTKEAAEAAAQVTPVLLLSSLNMFPPSGLLLYSTA